MDADGDGWSTCDGDCDDSSPLANPDQNGFFSVPLASGSFDYNCDGLETYYQPLLHVLLTGYPECAYQDGWLPSCAILGFDYSGVPECGGFGCVSGGYFPKIGGQEPHCSEFEPGIYPQRCN